MDPLLSLHELQGRRFDRRPFFVTMLLKHTRCFLTRQPNTTVFCWRIPVRAYDERFQKPT